MAYNQFTLDRVRQELGISTRRAELFPALEPSPVPDWLAGYLALNEPSALNSEKSRAEFLIAPVLVAAQAQAGNRFAIFSGQRFDVDPRRDLVGVCDFILTLGVDVYPLDAPVVPIVEAKREDIDQGLGQCIAQMVAARQFNEAAGKSGVPVYGCVSVGDAWQFLRLDGDIALTDRHRRYVTDVGGIIAAFRAIVDHAAGVTRAEA